MSSHLRLEHPSIVALPEPKVISPLIRFARWSALGLGVLYGAVRYCQICKEYADLREWEFEKKVASAKENEKKKKWMNKEEMRYIMKVYHIFINIIYKI